MVNCVTKCVRSFFSCLGCPLSNAPDYEHEIKPITEPIIEPMPEPESINRLNNIPEKPKRPETLKTTVSSDDSSADVFISPKSQDTPIEELFPDDKEVIHTPKQLEVRYGELSFRSTQIEKEIVDKIDDKIDDKIVDNIDDNIDDKIDDKIIDTGNSTNLLEFESPGSENKNYWVEEDIEDNIEEKIGLEEDYEADAETNNVDNVFSDNEE